MYSVFLIYFLSYAFSFRVLEAGKANVILPKSSPTGVTHIIASNARINAEKGKYNFKAPFYPIQYLGDFLLEVSKINCRHLKNLYCIKNQYSEIQSIII